MLIYITVAVLIVIFLVWTAVEQKILVTTKYTAISDRLPKAFHNTDFVVLADLHNYHFGRNNVRLLKRIEELAPEFIIVAGDMINKGHACYPGSVYSLLEQLTQKYKIFYAFGNHEQKIEQLIREGNANGIPLETSWTAWLQFRERLQKLGVIFLDNKSATFTKNGETIRITGVSISRRFFERTKVPPMEEDYLNWLIGKKPDERYHILIAHNPVYFQNYARWGADLTVSGHLHGGLVRLPFIGGVISPQVRLFPKYYAGVFTENGKQMIVSRGLGSHSAMPRIFNAPEIVSITLKKQGLE